MIAGLGLVVLALLAWLVGAHMRERRYFDRPGIARNRLFDPILAALGAVLLTAGLALLWRAAPAAAAITAGVLGGLGGWVGYVRGTGHRRRVFLRDVALMRRASPGLPERELLQKAVLARHPAWGDELVAQMVLDYPEATDLARVVARMERGFRGFR